MHATDRAFFVDEMRICALGELTGVENGTWHVDRKGEYVYTVDECIMARPSAVAARRCLAGRHLVFIGDSISRYMYLALASFLVSGRWPEDAPLAAGNMSLCHEATWKAAAKALNRSADPWNVYFECVLHISNSS